MSTGKLEYVPNNLEKSFFQGSLIYNFYIAHYINCLIFTPFTVKIYSALYKRNGYGTLAGGFVN